MIGCLAHASPPDVDPQSLSAFAELLERVKRLPPDHESAAFLVRDSRHDLHSVLWPEPTAARQAIYRGEIPAGTIAIAHTHPELPHLRMPSPQDADLARHSGLDVYVVTRAEIWVARGGTGDIVRVATSPITRLSRGGRESSPFALRGARSSR